MLVHQAYLIGENGIDRKHVPMYRDHLLDAHFLGQQEGLANRHVADDAAPAGALDVLQPDATLVGGITGLRRVALMAQEHNLVFTPHTWGNGIGVIANAHLAAGLADVPYLEFPYDPPEWSITRRDFPLQAACDVDANGWINLTEAPGMGFDLNEDLLARTRIG